MKKHGLTRYKCSRCGTLKLEKLTRLPKGWRRSGSFGDECELTGRYLARSDDVDLTCAECVGVNPHVQRPHYQVNGATARLPRSWHKRLKELVSQID